MSNEDDIILKLESILKRLAEDRTHLETLRQQGMAYAREQLTFDSRARVLTDVLLWPPGRGPKPKLEPPERVSSVAFE